MVKGVMPASSAANASRDLDLPLACLAPQLERRLPDLRETGRATGVTACDETAVGRDRDASAESEVAALDCRFGLALAAQAEQLVVLELFDRKGVVHLDEVQILRAEAGLLVGGARGVDRHARRPDHRADEEMAALVALGLQLRGEHADDWPAGPELLRERRRADDRARGAVADRA